MSNWELGLLFLSFSIQASFLAVDIVLGLSSKFNFKRWMPHDMQSDVMG